MELLKGLKRETAQRTLSRSSTFVVFGRRRAGHCTWVVFALVTRDLMSGFYGGIHGPAGHCPRSTSEKVFVAK